jgi:hypothetical protein
VPITSCNVNIRVSDCCLTRNLVDTCSSHKRLLLSFLPKSLLQWQPHAIPSNPKKYDELHIFFVNGYPQINKTFLNKVVSFNNCLPYDSIVKKIVYRLYLAYHYTIDFSYILVKTRSHGIIVCLVKLHVSTFLVPYFDVCVIMMFDSSVFTPISFVVVDVLLVKTFTFTEYGTVLTTVLSILFLYLNTVIMTAGDFEP